MNRRLLVVLAGAGAAVAGFGWYRRRDGTAPLAADVAPLWAARFEQPEGGELVMAAWRGKPLLLNFWATWCPPCVKEMPALDRFAKLHGRRIAVIGLAIDRPDAVRTFLQRTPVAYPVGLAGATGTELSRQLGNERAALPFTVVLSRAGDVVRRKLGETTEADLDGWSRLDL